MSELTKTCPVVRPVFAFVTPTNRVSLQGTQELELKQLGQNHHEFQILSRASENGWNVELFCIYCCAKGTVTEWQKAISQ